MCTILTVEGAHSFVANGFLVHNTAAAVKDEFGDGRWTLEAGALVLADRDWQPSTNWTR